MILRGYSTVVVTIAVERDDVGVANFVEISYYQNKSLKHTVCTPYIVSYISVVKASLYRARNGANKNSG